MGVHCTKMCGIWDKNIRNWINSIKSHEKEEWGDLKLQGKDGTKFLKYFFLMFNIINIVLI